MPSCAVGSKRWSMWIDHNRLERWNPRTCYKAESKVLYMCWGYSKQRHRLSGKWIKTHSGMKDWVVCEWKFWFGSAMYTHSSESQPRPGLHQKMHVQEAKGYAWILFYSFLWDSHLEYCVQIWGLQQKTDYDRMCPVESLKLMRGLEYLFYKEKLWELALFTLERKKLWRPC